MPAGRPGSVPRPPSPRSGETPRPRSGETPRPRTAESRTPEHGWHRPPKPSKPRTEHHGEILTSHPLDSVANVKASAATLRELAAHLTTVDTDQLDQLLEHLLQDGGLLHAAERLLARARTAVNPDLDETHPDPDSVPAYTLMHALARIDEDLNDRRMEALESLSAARTLVVPGPSPVHEAAAPAERTAQPFVTIRHTNTGEITTTRFNAAARRILLQAGFEETPGGACPAPETSTDRTHGPARQPASCSPPATPCACTEHSASR
ncbi:hypothetical protein P3T36_003381 [Kitasatospora sp. MAP12-15]|nr:hypothetical protein [Kitasatospora sp. MAP12-44]